MLAVIMSYAAIDHNPQNEFVAADGRYTSDLYVLFGAYFAMAAIPVATLWALSEWLLSRKD